MVTLCEPSPGWPAAFAAEAALIRARLGARALRIDHVGSTAVPGLVAKPVIDLQVSLASLAERREVAADLATLGYRHVHVGDFDFVYPFFAKGTAWPATHHVHLCAAGSPQERVHLAFRDCLRLHPAIAAEYVRLKRRLAIAHDGTTLASLEQYSLAKSAFVEAIVAFALRQGLPFPRASDG
ncbi:MAG: GrpB family protein [Burkholderiales bacterium]